MERVTPNLRETRCVLFVGISLGPGPPQVTCGRTRGRKSSIRATHAELIAAQCCFRPYPRPLARNGRRPLALLMLAVIPKLVNELLHVGITIGGVGCHRDHSRVQTVRPRLRSVESSLSRSVMHASRLLPWCGGTTGDESIDRSSAPKQIDVRRRSDRVRVNSIACFRDAHVPFRALRPGVLR